MNKIKVSNPFTGEISYINYEEALNAEADSRQQPKPTYRVVGNRIIYNSNPQPKTTTPSSTVRVDGNRVIYNSGVQKRKRVGLIQCLINIMNTKPIMFVTSEYPPRIDRIR